MMGFEPGEAGLFSNPVRGVKTGVEKDVKISCNTSKISTNPYCMEIQLFFYCF